MTFLFELKEQNDIKINHYGTHELGFKDRKICEDFIHDISNLWTRWIEDEDKLCMQFIANIVKSMNIKGYITIDDLYNLSEKDVPNKDI